MRSAPFFEPIPSAWVSGLSLAAKRRKNDQHHNLEVATHLMFSYLSISPSSLSLFPSSLSHLSGYVLSSFSCHLSLHSFSHTLFLFLYLSLGLRTAIKAGRYKPQVGKASGRNRPQKTTGLKKGPRLEGRLGAAGFKRPWGKNKEGCRAEGKPKRRDPHKPTPEAPNFKH